MACCSLLLIVVMSSCLLLVGCDPLGDSAAGAAVNDESAMMERFIRWMAAQKRSYSSVEEKQRRFEIYASNVRYIEEVNAKGLTYVLGEGPFTDLTHDEFVARYTDAEFTLGHTRLILTRLVSSWAGPSTICVWFLESLQDGKSVAMTTRAARNITLQVSFFRSAMIDKFRSG